MPKLMQFIENEHALEELFTLRLSGKIKISACQFFIENFNSQFFQQYDLLLPDSISRAVIKRQGEFFAGRLMARKALALLGIESHNVAIGDDRTPVWPNNISGSISHNNQIALCIVANKDQFNYVGCDVESFITIKTQTEISDTIITPAEEYLIRRCPLGQQVTFTLVFSAKESLFKALYPSVKKYFDFSAANIYEINPKTQTFKLKLAETLTDTLIKNTVFEGFYILNHTYITTFIIQ